MANNEELNEQNKLYNELIQKAKAFHNVQKDTESAYQNVSDHLKNVVSRTEEIRKFSEDINKVYWDQGNALQAIQKRHKKRLENAKNVYKTERDIGKRQAHIDKVQKEAQKALNKAREEGNQYAINQNVASLEYIEKQRTENEIHKAQNEALKEQVDQLGFMYRWYGQIHGSVGNTLEMLQSMASSVLPVAGSLLRGIVSALQKAWEFGKEIFDTFLNIQSITGNLQADLGLTNQQFNTIRERASSIADEALRYGMNYEEALGFTREISDLTGKNRAILGDQVEIMASISKSTGLGAEGAAKFYSNFALLGKPITSVKEHVDAIAERSTTLGLNVTKTLENTSELVKESSGLRFDGGVESISKLVQKAQSLRVEIESLSGLADDFMKPEDAVEKAAGLRVLGGEFAKMADPMQLMFEAQHAPDRIAEGFLDAAKNLAVYNEELGRFEIPAQQRMRMQQAVENVNMEFDQLKNSALQSAKNMRLMDQISPEAKKILSDEQLKGIANMAKMTEEGKGYIEMTSGSEFKTMLSNFDKLSKEQMQQVTQRTENEREIAMTRQNLVEQFNNIYRRFQMAFVPMFNSLDAMLKDSGLMGELRLTFDELQEVMESHIAPLFNEGGPVYKALFTFGDAIESSISTFRNAFDPNGDVWAQLRSGFGTLARDLAEDIWVYLRPIMANAMKFGVKHGVEALTGYDYEADYLNIPGMNMGGDKNNQTGMKRTSVDDFIYNPKENRLIDFNKDDLVMGGTNMKQDKGEPTTEFPTDININVNGTLTIEGENNSAQLSENDLRNIGMRQLAKRLMEEMEAMKRSGGIKKTNPTPPIT